MIIPFPRLAALNEDATWSTDTSNSFANWKYPAVARGEIVLARLAENTLSNEKRSEGIE